LLRSTVFANARGQIRRHHRQPAAIDRSGDEDQQL
jgi:hypothetical protein